MEKKNSKTGMNLNAKSFVSAILVIFVLMVLSYVLTFIIPGGSYTRIVNDAGQSIIDTTVPFQYTEGGIPFLKWILSPILVLGGNGGGTIIAILIFLLVIGGVFNCLDKSGTMKYLLQTTAKKFAGQRYKLLFLLSLIFMAMGSLIGSFEEVVPMVPIVAALCISLGFDAVTGLMISILAAGCGFAAGVCNPFSVGVAQKLAGLPMFSGIWYRIVAFILIYALLTCYTTIRAKRIAQPIEITSYEFEENPKLKKALICFGIIFGIGLLCILSSSFITALQDYTMIIISLVFLIGGISASILAGFKGKALGKGFLNGVVSMLPAVLMILMASSIKFILEEAKILDTILHAAVGLAEGLPAWSIILLIYLIALVMNFFIASGTAKAFLLIPLIAPLAQIFGIPAQLCVMAYAFGDGFSNVFYVTNPVLLISLGIADVSYGKWVKSTGLFQLFNLILTSALLVIGYFIGYC